MNVFTFSGNLGQDPEVRYTISGSCVASFSVAVRSGYGDRVETTWVRCSLWGEKRVQGLAHYLKKGKQVVVSGELTNRKYEHNGETKYSLEVRVNEIDLIGGRDASGDSPAARERMNQERVHRGGESPPDEGFEDDIPF